MTTSTKQIAVTAIVILLATILAGVARAQESTGTVYYVQPVPPDVVAWEWEILEGDWMPLDVSGILVDPCPQCWQIDITVPQPGFIRSRAVGEDGLLSEWSNALPVPEPGVGISVAIGALWLAGRRRDLPDQTTKTRIRRTLS